MNKRWFALFLVMVMVVSRFGVVSAKADDESSYIISEIRTALPYLLENELSGEFFLGSQMSAYKAENDMLVEIDYELYPVFQNEKIVAFASVENNSLGERVVGCSVGFANALYECNALEICSAYALIYSAEGVYLVGNNGMRWLVSDVVNEHYSSFDAVDEYLEDIDYEPIKRISAFADVPALCTIIDTKIISVPYVANDVMPECEVADCHAGLCWAASMAMIVRCYTGVSYTAREFHEDSGYHSYGSCNDYKSCLSKYGISSNLLYVFGKNYIQNAVDSNLFGYMRLQNLSSESGHVVVACGYAIDETGIAGFYYVDPNYALCYQTFPSSGDLVVTTMGGTTYSFDYWLVAQR